MFTASANSAEGKRLLVLGLSAENVRRMKHGHPIRVSREIHGLAVPADLTIVIFAGETEAQMEADMRRMGLIGPTTVMNQKDEH
jgi:hypothetical protein